MQYKLWIKKLLKFHKRLRYGDLPLQKKIMLNQLILLAIPFFIVYSLLFSVYIKDKKNETENFIHISTRQAIDNIDNYIFQLKELTKQPLYDEKVISSLMESNERIEKINVSNRMNDIDLGTWYYENWKNGSVVQTPKVAQGFSREEEKNISIVINRVMPFNKNIYSVFVYNCFGYNVNRISDNGLIKSYNPYRTEWFEKCFSLGGKPLITSSSRWLSDYVEKRGDDLFVFSVSRAIKSLNSTEQIGVITICSNVKFFEGVFDSLRSIDGERFLIIDPEGTIVFDDNNQKNIGINLDNHPNSLIELKDINDALSSKTYQKAEVNYFVDVAKFNESDWRLIRIIPQKAMDESVTSVERNAIILIAAFILLSMILSYSVSYRITKPLKKLMNTMKKVEAGNLTVFFKVKYRDEVGKLGHTFNKMVRRVNRLVEVIYDVEKRKKEAELNALQSQINPHFIYNTLETIRMTAELNDDRPVAKMIFTLGKLLRYSINVKSQIVTVGQEIEHLKNYITLQNTRFAGKFEFVVDIDENLYSLSIIKLIFQPIVENAISHGFGNNEGGTIRIKGYEKDEKIYFEISNDGETLSDEALQELNKSINIFSNIQKEYGGIGLKNVNERLKLQYGDEYGIKIMKGHDKGMIVLFEVPNIIIKNSSDEIQE